MKQETSSEFKMTLNESTSKNYRYLPAIASLFTASILISNVLNSKVLRVGPVPMTGGITLFPLAYVFGDVLTEVYGYAESRRVIWTGFACLILLAAMIVICGALPADSSWPYQQAYNVILGRVPRIIAASMLAYFLGEFSNSFVLAKLKIKTQGKLISLRFVVSTFFGEFVDTIVFVLAAFVGVLSPGKLVAIASSGWILKVVWEIVVLPITLPIVKSLKRREQVDYFDTNTEFSPLRF